MESEHYGKHLPERPMENKGISNMISGFGFQYAESKRIFTWNKV
jgi:hypothetical protein